MKVWIRRFAIIGMVTVLIGIAAWVVLLETFLTWFGPNLLLQLALPLVLALLGIAVWRMIEALYRWAPRNSRSQISN